MLIYQVKFNGLIGNIFDRGKGYSWTICRKRDKPGNWSHFDHCETFSQAREMLFKTLLIETGDFKKSSQGRIDAYDKRCVKAFEELCEGVK